MVRPLARILAVFALVAASACAREAPKPVPTARPDVRAPEGLLLEASVDDVGAFLTSVRTRSSSPLLGAFLPEDAASLVARFAETPEALRRHVPANARLRYVLVRRDEHTKAALAVRITREADPARPLGAEIALFDGGPHDSRYVLGRPQGSAPAIALRDDMLVLADDSRTLELALPYLDTLFRRDVGAGARVRIPEGVLGTKLRPVLDIELERASRDLSSAAHAERARHAEEPAIADPERVIAFVRDPIRRAIAFLPDTGDFVLDARASETGIDLDARIAVREGTPLSRALASSPSGAPFGLLALPKGTAFAFSSRRGASDEPLVSWLASLAGNRLSAVDREALTAASRALGGARGEASITALGSTPEGPYVLFGAEKGEHPIDTNALREALAVPYVTRSLGSVVGCPGGLSPAAPREGTWPLCRRREAPFPSLETVESERGIAVALTQLATSSTPSHPAPHTFLSSLPEGARDALGDDPDLSRAVGALGDHVMFAALLSPERVLPSLAFFDSPVLRRLARVARPAESEAPTLVAISRESGTLRARVLVTPRGLDPLLDLGSILSSLFEDTP